MIRRAHGSEDCAMVEPGSSRRGHCGSRRKVSIMRIAPERLLYQQRQAVKSLAHIGVAG